MRSMAGFLSTSAPLSLDSDLQQPASSVRSAVLAGMDRSVPGLIAGLEAEGVHTWSAEHGREAIQVAGTVEPELILVGEELDMDPSTVVGELRRVSPEARILFLMSNSSHRRAAFLVSLGVDDVLSPPHSAASVLLRAYVGPLLEERRSRVDSDGGADRLVVDRFSRSILDPTQPTSLTAREFDLLERLLQADGRVVSRSSLLSDIWGEMQDNEAVLDATVHRLRRKLEKDHSSPQLLVTIRGVGYRLESNRVSISEH
jgi:two-component system, OmpR family, response regulator RegX3